MTSKWEVSFADIIQIVLILITMLGGWTAIQNWKTSTQDHVDAIIQEQSEQKKSVTEENKEIHRLVGNVNTRLSRIEGKLNIRDGDGN